MCEVSHEVRYQIAHCREVHTIAENLESRVLVGIVFCVFGDKHPKAIEEGSISNSTV
jgi:hypothetical protein